jgi:hypothetical protein
MSNMGKQSVVAGKAILTKKPGEKGLIDPLLEPQETQEDLAKQKLLNAKKEAATTIIQQPVTQIVTGNLAIENEDSSIQREQEISDLSFDFSVQNLQGALQISQPVKF